METDNQNTEEEIIEKKKNYSVLSRFHGRDSLWRVEAWRPTRQHIRQLLLHKLSFLSLSPFPNLTQTSEYQTQTQINFWKIASFGPKFCWSNPWRKKTPFFLFSQSKWSTNFWTSVSVGVRRDAFWFRSNKKARDKNQKLFIMS